MEDRERTLSSLPASLPHNPNPNHNPNPDPSTNPRGSGKGRVGVGLWLVYLVLEHEVFREAGLRSRDKILCSDWSPVPLSRRTCVQTRRSRQTMFQKRCLVCQKLCRNILFGQSNGKVCDTDMSLI